MNMHPDQDPAIEKVTCPHCRSTQTEIFSLFGQQLLIVQYYCQNCHTPFEAVKDESVLTARGVAHIAEDATRRDHHDDVHSYRKEKRS